MNEQLDKKQASNKLVGMSEAKQAKQTPVVVGSN